MPNNPSPAQQAASRENGAKSAGPADPSETRFNALRHGFTATLAPPNDPEERQRYDALLTGLYEEFLPCSCAEWLVLEEIVVLELRRIKLQQALMDDLDFASADEPALKRLALLSRYETDTLNKLDKKWRKFKELQESRAQRRGLSLEAALLQHKTEAMKQQMRDSAFSLADRALGREMLDLAIPPEEAARATRALLAPTGRPAPQPRTSSHAAPSGSGSFRNEPQSSRTETLERADPDAPLLPEILPGPPWDPWRGISPEQLERWNDELIERKKNRLRQELSATSKP